MVSKGSTNGLAGLVVISREKNRRDKGGKKQVEKSLLRNQPEVHNTLIRLRIRVPFRIPTRLQNPTDDDLHQVNLPKLDGSFPQLRHLHVYLAVDLQVFVQHQGAVQLVLRNLRVVADRVILFHSNESGERPQGVRNRCFELGIELKCESIETWLLRDAFIL